MQLGARIGRASLENNDSETPTGNILPRKTEELSICGSSSVIMGKKN